jgi:putative membrane protein
VGVFSVFDGGGLVLKTRQYPAGVGKRKGVMRVILDLLRGVLIGTAEIIPGVSGGTIALIVRVYQSIIRSASGVVRGVVGVVVPSLRRKNPWSEVEWTRIIPILVGMFVAIFVAAAILEPILDAYPIHARAVFAGLIAMSLVVPISMVGSRWKVKDMLFAGTAAAVSFVLVGLPGLTVSDPSLLLVAPAAAIAVCALVLPGVSGSFLLLALGIYEPTLSAVNDRDVAYLGVFIAGAIVGLGSFVLVLQWLLTNRRRITLVVMTGLMVGSLRALWPWQGESRELLGPDPASLPSVVGLFVAGVTVVAVLLFVERVISSDAEKENSRA